jgi:hypothetical protein
LSNDGSKDGCFRDGMRREHSSRWGNFSTLQSAVVHVCFGSSSTGRNERKEQLRLRTRNENHGRNTVGAITKPRLCIFPHRILFPAEAIWFSWRFAICETSSWMGQSRRTTERIARSCMATGMFHSHANRHKLFGR